MSTGASGSDEKLSASKIEPLESETKYNEQSDLSSRGAVGSDRNIDQSRTEPLGGSGQYQHPESHADSQGVVGRDNVIQQSKIDPLAGSGGAATAQGLDDENVDASRVDPLGEVRAEFR